MATQRTMSDRDATLFLRATRLACRLRNGRKLEPIDGMTGAIAAVRRGLQCMQGYGLAATDDRRDVCAVAVGTDGDLQIGLSRRGRPLIAVKVATPWPSGDYALGRDPLALLNPHAPRLDLSLMARGLLGLAIRSWPESQDAFIAREDAAFRTLQQLSGRAPA